MTDTTSSARPEHRSALRLPIGIIVLCLTSLALLWTALVYEIDRSRDAAIEAAVSNTRNLALVFRGNVERKISAIDQMLILIAAENGGEDNKLHIPAWAIDSTTLKDMSIQVSVIGPHGILAASSLGVTHRVNLSDRRYFRYQLDPSARQPYISVPEIGGNFGKWSIQITRRITRRDGSFGGVVVVSVDPFYFSRFFKIVDVGRDGVVGLVGRDGIVRARGANNSITIGQNVGRSPFFAQILRSNAGLAIFRGKLDDVARIYSYSAVPGYPLFVVAGEAVNDVLAAPNRQRRLFIAAGAILTIFIVMLGWYVAWESQRRQERELASFAEEKTREQKELLTTAIDNMRHGLVMFDRDGHALVINKYYREMYGLSPDAAKPGCTLRQLLEQRKVAGTFDGNIDDYIRNVNASGSEFDRVIDISTGQSIRVVSRFMPNGRWVSTHEDVTEQRRALASAETALAEAERAGREAIAAHTSLREAFAVVPEGLALFDAEDRIVLWNERYAQYLEQAASPLRVGVKFEDTVRAGLAAGMFPEAKGREAEWLAERLAQHAKDNSVHEQPLSGNRVIRICERRTADGGSVGVRIDITELKEREKSVRMLFDLNPVPMFVVDCDDLKFIAVNESAVSHYGYSREQFLTMTKPDIHPPEDRQVYADAFRAFRESGRDEFDWKIVRRHRKADGKDILVNVYGKRLNYNGRPALLCSAVDVTERVHAEEERDRNRKFLDRIIESVSVTIIVKDAQTLKYVLVNRAAEKLWGLPRNEVIGKRARDIFDQETADNIERYDLELRDKNSSFLIPAHKVTMPRNGVRLMTATRIPIRDHEGKQQFLLSVIEDVTDRQMMEDQLRQAQKMEAIGKLTGGISHDFNNLLTVILGNLDLLQEELAGHVSAEEKIALIAQAAERGAELTRHMLAFSRRQPLQTQEVDTNALIASTMRLLSHTLGENISIEFELTPEGPLALVDPTQLETALLNIAINARDAMANGGTLTITTRVSELDDAYTARHLDVTPGYYAQIEIADTGAGIAPEHIERIFEPFFTTKADGQGTGLGLSMVYGFLKQSGGHIRAYSELGHGTVFKLYLPLARPPVEVPLVDAPPLAAAKPAGNGVILVVEDNSQIRMTVVRQLQNLGYQVVEAEDANAALEILTSDLRIDLLFTDMVMPGGLNGKELATKARALRPALKVLFTSGFPGISNALGGQLEDGDVLLSKPYRQRDLAEAIQEILRVSAY